MGDTSIATCSSSAKRRESLGALGALAPRWRDLLVGGAAGGRAASPIAGCVFTVQEAPQRFLRSLHVPGGICHSAAMTPARSRSTSTTRGTGKSGTAGAPLEWR